jgi:hypothetical protein
MRFGWLVVAAAAFVTACTWIPFIGSTGGPRLTNAAVEACEGKAREVGYRGIGERQSMPGPEGRYTVELDVREDNGYGQVSCTFDPAKGAEIAPPKQSAQ